MAKLPPKNQKTLSTFRLPETTRQQLKSIVEHEAHINDYSEADIIEWAVEYVYVTEYLTKFPDQFSNIRTFPNYPIQLTF